MSTAPAPTRIRLVVLSAIALTFFLRPAPAHAQPTVNLSLGGALDTFAAVDVAAENRQDLLGGLNVEHLFGDERGRATYDLDGGRYDSPGDWSYFEHRAGLSYRWGAAEPTARKLFLTGSFVHRANGDAWTTATYSGLGAGFNAEFHPHPASTVRTGYRVDVRRFADLAALTQQEHRVFASALRSFETRTTLVAEAQLGVKRYDGSTFTQVLTTPDPAAGSATSGASVAGGGGSGATVHAQGPGMGPSLRGGSTTTLVSSTEDGNVRMVTGLVRVAQSLTDRTGLTLQAQVRRTAGSVPPVLVTTPAGFFEDGVYDDPFASDAVFLQAGVTRAFAGGAELTASAWFVDKDFTGAVALGSDGQALAGSPLRSDRVALARAGWSVPLVPSRTGALSLRGELGYRFLRQRSNDTFYNYTSHAVTLGVTVGY